MASQDNRLLPLASSRGLDSALPEQLPTAAGRDYIGATSVGGASSNGRYGYGPATEQIHLRDYLAVVLKRKWLILSILLVVTSIVALQMYRLPAVYEAAVTIQIEPKRSVLEKNGLVVSTNDANYWPTQIKLLENPELARQVVLALNLHNNPTFLGGQARPGVVTNLRRIVSRKRSGGGDTAAQDAAVPVLNEGGDFSGTLAPEQLEQLEPYENALTGGLKVTPITGTNLVKIAFRHTDPQMTSDVANTLAQVFINSNVDRETVGAQKNSALLAKQIADLQGKIREQQAQRLNYLKSHNLPLADATGLSSSGGKGTNLTADRLAQLSTQLLVAEDQRKTLQSLHESAANEPDVWSIPEVQDSRVVQALRLKIEDLEEKREALLVQYTPEYPDMKKLDKQIKRLNQELDKAPREIVTAMQRRSEAARSRVGKLEQSYNQELAKSAQQTQATLGISTLNQEIETNQQYFNTLFQKQKEIEVTSNDKANNVTVATPAQTPRGPIGPQRMRNVIIAFLLALGAGIGLAFLLDYLDDTVKSLEDVDRHIHLPTLALVPAPRVERSLLKGRGQVPDPVQSTALALIEDVRSPMAEAYRHLRTSLLLSSAGQPPRSILVTSSQPSEGKTTTAVNIAMMLAQNGADVLIVDCDLRRPRIHAHFGMSNTRGVTNYLASESDLESLMQPYGKQPNLMVMPSGPVPPSPAELLGSDEMRKLLNILSDRFTHVIVDSPPAVSFTDASILSTLVDGVMLVVHAGRSSRAVIRRAKQQLLDVGAHIYGVVLNNVKPESGDYYYYSGNYASYYANEDAPNPNGSGTGLSSEQAEVSAVKAPGAQV